MSKEKFFRFLLAIVCCSSATAAVYGCVSEQKGSVNQSAGNAEVMKGEQLYTRYCKSCHAMGPPPKIAPPIKGLAMHYREAFSEKEAAVEHMVMFMQKPDPALSKCRPEAIERFGLMPAMNVSEEKLRAVSEWLWDQFDPELKKRHAKEHDH